MTDKLSMDAVVLGGGAAGLWLLDELLRAGYSTLLLEAHELGSGQTIASQGIIHGGLKYTLGGLLTPSAKSISGMPAIWRKCLAGEAKPDLSATKLRAPYCHLWRTASLKSRLAMIGARAGLQVEPVQLSDEERPEILAKCPGSVARLDEQVIDPSSFVTDLSWQNRLSLLKVDAEHGLEFVPGDGGAGQVQTVRLIDPDSGRPLDIHAQWIILAAGAGNSELRKRAGLANHAMQRRPLHMVLVRGPEAMLPVLNGHCVDGAKTRVTITSARDFSNRRIWQVGGQIAEDGVSMDSHDLVEHAQAELTQVLPGIDLAVSGIQWSTYRVDRAEAATGSSRRPEDASIIIEGNTITIWPTKLALVPDLFHRIQLKLGPPSGNVAEIHKAVTDWPRPVVALPPWENVTQWIDAH